MTGTDESTEEAKLPAIRPNQPQQDLKRPPASFSSPKSTFLLRQLIGSLQIELLEQNQPQTLCLGEGGRKTKSRLKPTNLSSGLNHGLGTRKPHCYQQASALLACLRSASPTVHRVERGEDTCPWSQSNRGQTPAFLT